MRCEIGYMEYRGYCIPDSFQFAEAINKEEKQKRASKKFRNAAIALAGLGGATALTYGALKYQRSKFPNHEIFKEVVPL